MRRSTTGSASALVAVALVSFLAPTRLFAQEKVDFEKDVWPILEAKCLSCHKATYQDEAGRLRKPKGDLRLDGRAWIEKGGNSGPAIEKGDGELSELYIRLILDADDPDLMPKDEEPLPEAQRAVIKTWIDQGADFGAWVGVGAAAEGDAPTVRPPAAPNPRIAHLEAVAGKLRPLSRSSIEKAVEATGGRARIAPMWAGSPLLRVEWFAAEGEVTDDHVEALDKVADRITHLDLSRTAVTDRVMRAVLKMERLTRLDLRNTKVTDGGLEKVAKLAHLRSLNLYGLDGISDETVKVLMTMSSLRNVYLHGTSVSPMAADSLQRTLEQGKVRFEPDFPVDPGPEDEPARRGRRRRR